MTGYLSEFAEDEGYLDFARTGPPSRSVVAAGTDALATVAAAGPGTVDRLMQAEDRALTAASRLLGFARDRVVYTPSTSAGLFQVAFALAGTVLVSPAEFPANRYPWARAATAGRIAVSELPARPVTTDVVASALADADADGLVVSAVDFATGFRADLAGLREVLGDRLLVVDGIQGVGAVDQDWTAADVLVTGGQKWLRSGWGTGVLAVSDRALDRLDPLLAGWTAVQDPTVHDGEEHPLKPGAARFATTNTSPVAQACLAAGLELLESVGVGWVAGRIAERVEELLAVLDRHGAAVTSSREPDRRAGIVAFAEPGAYDALTAAGVTCTRHGERVRLSVHATTTSAALDRVDAALARVTV